MKVVIDTNALLLPFECKIDIFRESEKLVEGKAEFVVFEGSLAELSTKSRKFMLRAASIRSGIVREGGEIRNGRGKVDDLIIAYAKENHGNVAVITEDRALMDKLREMGQVQLIYSKKRDHLSTDWRRSE